MSSERAAIAREVLAEAAANAPAHVTGAWQWLHEYRDKHYPAPPAQETVTVGMVQWRLTDTWRNTYDRRKPNAGDAVEFLDRIAADARRIVELEESERTLYDSMWQAIDRMGNAVGAMTGLGSNCHVTAQRVCETIETLKAERDEARRALEGANGTKGEGRGEVGVSTAAHGGSSATQPDQGESPVAAPSPAPIPLGAVPSNDYVVAVMEDAYGTNGCDINAAAMALAREVVALRHPVATRETVERAAKAANTACLNGRSIATLWHDIARAALTAAGITLEEGA